MDNDGALALFFLGLFSIACNFLFFFGSTMDYRIRQSDKIVLEHAVYKCEKIQELDLK